MDRRVYWVAIAGVLIWAALLGGCSGAGVPVADVRGDDLRAMAEDHLSAVLLFRSWTNVLHRRMPQADAEGTGTAQGCATALDTEILGDGSTHMWGTNSDCSVFDYITTIDNITTGFIEWPNGMRMDGIWYAPGFDDTGTLASQHAVVTFEDGTQLDYVHSVDMVTPLSPQIMDGSARRRDGQEMDFWLSRTQNAEDHLIIDLPDGAQMEIRIPLQAMPGTLYWPVFEAGATGTYANGAGPPLDFEVRGEDDEWNMWRFEAGDGTVGTFAVGEEFGGTGQLLQGDNPIAGLRWDAPTTGTLDIVAATTWQVSPSAAARDFQVDQWIANAIALNPTPMY